MGIFAMLFAALIVPCAMCAAGYFMLRFPPSEPNAVIGYRTRRSRSGKAAWAFAQRYCGRIWIRTGAALALISAAAVLIWEERAIMYLTFSGIAVMLLSILPVERKLKQNFDDKGNPLT